MKWKNKIISGNLAQNTPAVALINSSNYTPVSLQLKTNTTEVQQLHENTKPKHKHEQKMLRVANQRKRRTDTDFSDKSLDCAMAFFTVDTANYQSLNVF